MSNSNENQPDAFRKKYPAKDWGPNPKELDQEKWRFFLNTIEFNNFEWMQRWIIDNPYAENKVGYNAIYSKLHYRSLVFPEPIKSNEKQQQEVFAAREIFFNVYPLNYQLDLLTYFYTSDKFNIEPTLKLIAKLHFDFTDPEDWEQILQHEFFGKTFARLFSEENFQAINQIEHLVGVPLFEDTFEHSFILLKPHLMEKDSQGKKTNQGNSFFQWMNSDLVTFKAWHQILFDYSEFKEHYLDKRGIALPDSEYVTHLRHTFYDIQKNLAQQSQPVSDSLIALEKGLDLYDKVLSYKRLTSELDIDAQDDEHVAPKMKI
jgi:hypothetical protein